MNDTVMMVEDDPDIAEQLSLHLQIDCCGTRSESQGAIFTAREEALQNGDANTAGEHCEPGKFLLQ